jgi:hypothetical protein
MLAGNFSNRILNFTCAAVRGLRDGSGRTVAKKYD